MPQVPDYAVANGQGGLSSLNGKKSIFFANGWESRLLKNPNFKISNHGTVWTRTAINYGEGGYHQVKLVRFLSPAEHSDGAARYLDQPNFVMPRFQNPAAFGIGVADLDDSSVLTIDGAVAYWPQAHALLPAESTVAREEISHHYRDTNGACRHFQGANYVQVECNEQYYTQFFTDGVAPKPGQKHWFKLQPVRAMRCADGSVQCLDSLVKYPFISNYAANAEFQKSAFPVGQDVDLDTDAFAIGSYLKQKFLHDLQSNTALVAAVNRQLTALNVTQNQDLSRGK